MTAPSHAGQGVGSRSQVREQKEVGTGRSGRGRHGVLGGSVRAADPCSEEPARPLCASLKDARPQVVACGEMIPWLGPAECIVVDAGLPPPLPRPHIMGMPLPLPTYTVDMVRAFPDDGQRYELVEGMLLVTPQPASDHQIVAGRLAAALHSYLRVSGLAHVVSPGEIEIAPKLHLEPDVLVFPSTFPPGTNWPDISGWWLAVEVLSPSSRFYDRDYKLEAYLGVGVEEMWLVDLDRRCVEVSALDGRRLEPHFEHVRWQPAAMPEPCELDLAELFRDVP